MMEKNEHGDSILPPVARHVGFMDQHSLERLGHYIVIGASRWATAAAPTWPTACSSPASL
jgi:hypothetical protein